MTLDELKNAPPMNLPACETVGELIAVLQKLPADLPLHPYDDGVKPVIFNQRRDVQLHLEENDGTWDDDEDDE